MCIVLYNYTMSFVVVIRSRVPTIRELHVRDAIQFLTSRYLLAILRICARHMHMHMHMLLVTRGSRTL